MTFKLWSVGSSRSHEKHEAHTPVWRLMSFEDLRVGELYEALRLRSEVFVVEQQCVFQDIDGADREAMHLLGVQGDELTAYARCFEAGAKFPEASIGRVAVRKSARGTGLGHLLMAQAVAAIVAAGPWLQERFGIGLTLSAPTAEQWLLLAAVLAAGFTASLVPGWRAYRLSLADGLSPRV